MLLGAKELQALGPFSCGDGGKREGRVSRQLELQFPQDWESGEENELRKADIRKNRNSSTFNSQIRVLLHVSWTGLCREEHKHSIVPNTFTHIIRPHRGGHSVSKYSLHY